MHDCYDWLKDIWLPLLTGGGSVVVGAAAIWVARRSHRLAEDVRTDEKKRDNAAARERYRDQLFRTIEPAVSALLEHRAELNLRRVSGSAEDRNLRSGVVARLRLVDVVVNEEDRKVVKAALDAYRSAVKTEDWYITGTVAGRLAVRLPRLLADDRDVDAMVERFEKEVGDATKQRADLLSGNATTNVEPDEESETDSKDAAPSES